MSDTDITSAERDGMGPRGTKVGLLRVLGPAHVWALGVGIVLVGEYMGWNFAVGKGGAYAALVACWFAGILYTCVAMIACSNTSASECPSRPFSHGISTPPRISALFSTSL